MCESPTLFFFKIILAFLSPCVSTWIWGSASAFLQKKGLWHFAKDGTESVDDFGECNHFNFLKYDPGKSLNLHVSLNVFFNDSL